MKNSFVIIFVFSLFTIISNGLAVSFTVNVEPGGSNAGQTNQLVNFSITNAGNINITQVNITLPPGFTFKENSGTTASGYIFSSSPISWINTSSTGIIGNGKTEYFWFNIDTPVITDDYSFNVSILDANAIFNSSNITFPVFDTLAPQYSDNITSPDTNASYSPNQAYWFNITWTDNVGISKVLLEHNFTGDSTLHNETMSNESNVYYVKFTDLSVGIYVWRIWANDTNNTFNSTNQLTYKIQKAANMFDVFLNGSLNHNITVINNTAVNLTVNSTCKQAGCTITIIKDKSTTLVSGTTPPIQLITTLTSIGLHNFTISIASNTNYTSNTSTYYVASVPSYSTSTSNIPLTFSNTTVGSINITFANNPSLINVLLEGDWSGSATNYTMSNFSNTDYYYNLTFPAGTFNWKIYGVYSDHYFNLTDINTFTINKATPTITLKIIPDWTLDTPVQTNVSCSLDVPELSAKLYRNGTLVTNPDVQTFGAGNIYEYLCNNTVNQNYTSTDKKNILVIKPKPTATLEFVDTPTLIEVTQEKIANITVKVKNTGKLIQNVTLEILDLDNNWYSITPPVINILVGMTSEFTVKFDVGNAKVNDYKGRFNASSINATTVQDFTLRVLPSDETKLKINDTLALLKLDTVKLETIIAQKKEKGIETPEIETKLNEIKAKLQEAEDNINLGDYFSAYQSFDEIRALITETENLLKVSSEEARGIEISRIWVYIGVGVIILIGIGVILYLFLPTKHGYKVETGEYIWSGKKEETKWNRLKDKLKNLFLKFKFKKERKIELNSKS